MFIDSKFFFLIQEEDLLHNRDLVSLVKPPFKEDYTEIIDSWIFYET